MGKRNNRGLVVIERGAGAGALLWLLVGGAVGAGLGLLFAPQSGEDTRKLLKERLAGLKQSAQDALEDLSGEAEDEDEDEELEAGEEDEEVEEAEAEAIGSEEEDDADEPKTTRPSARVELEQRLARARARRQRALAEEDEEPVA